MLDTENAQDIAAQFNQLMRSTTAMSSDMCAYASRTAISSRMLFRRPSYARGWISTSSGTIPTREAGFL